MPRVLLLGGTSEASQLASAFAAAGINSVFSYAGRTAAPVDQPLPVRIGGFGGAEGLAAYLQRAAITHVVDATHPFAAQMSRNAVTACAATGTPLIAYEREAWRAGPGDDWQHVADIDAAVAALPEAPARIFLAIGRQHLAAFARRPEHFYLLRLVDAPEAPLPLPHADVVVARGPFTAANDIALMQQHRITYVVSKNAGGSGARAKLDAACALRLPVIVINRPQLPRRSIARDVATVLDWLGHPTRLGV